MRALIVGWGNIGRRHARCLRALVPDCELVVWRSGKGDGEAAELQGSFLRCVYSTEDAVAVNADFAIICNPAPFHIPTAQSLAERGLPLLIEKPLSDNVVGIGELQRTCRAHAIPAMVGYVLRFDPLLQAVASQLRKGAIGRVASARLAVSQYLPNWRPNRNWRETVSARKDLGGGALLELSHEIDLACWLFGQPRAVSARIPPNTLTGIDVEDTAELLLDTEADALVSIHLDFLGQPKRRAITMVGEFGTIEADLVAGTGRHWSTDSSCWKDIEAPAVAGDDIYLAQLRHFMGVLKGESQPAIGLADGERVLRVIAAARRSSAEGRTVQL